MISLYFHSYLNIYISILAEWNSTDNMKFYPSSNVSLSCSKPFLMLLQLNSFGNVFILLTLLCPHSHPQLLHVNYLEFNSRMLLNAPPVTYLLTIPIFFQINTALIHYYSSRTNYTFTRSIAHHYFYDLSSVILRSLYSFNFYFIAEISLSNFFRKDIEMLYFLAQCFLSLPLHLHDILDENKILESVFFFRNFVVSSLYSCCFNNFVLFHSFTVTV